MPFVTGTLFVCHCGRKYKSKSALKLHARDHSGQFPFQCRYCKQGFSQMRRLREHEARHTGKPVAVCDVCGFEAKSFYGLQTHKNIHLENKFACPHCDKVFYSKQALSRHQQLHPLQEKKWWWWCTGSNATGVNDVQVTMPQVNLTVLCGMTKRSLYIDK